MGFAMQCSSYCSCISISVPHRFPQAPPLSFHAARKNQRIRVLCGSDRRSSNLGSERKRKIVEHVCLLKAKQDLSEEEENDMLDHLYTTQYQMGGVVAISLGSRGPCTDLLPCMHQHGLVNVDFESEVDDEMLSIFRKGEEFNHGVEFLLLISFNESALSNQAEDALASLASMMSESPSLIVQFTQGLNFSPSSKEYTHGVVIRFRSVEAFEIFINSKEYKNVWHSKFQPIAHKYLSLHFSVDPVGTEIM